MTDDRKQRLKANCEKWRKANLCKSNAVKRRHYHNNIEKYREYHRDYERERYYYSDKNDAFLIAVRKLFR